MLGFKALVGGQADRSGPSPDGGLGQRALGRIQGPQPPRGASKLEAGWGQEADLKCGDGNLGTSRR